MDDKEKKLVEIGPRFSLTPVRLFGDFLGGETLWSSTTFISPARLQATRMSGLVQRRQVKKKAKDLVTQQKYDDKMKEEDNLFSKEDQ